MRIGLRYDEYLTLVFRIASGVIEDMSSFSERSDGSAADEVDSRWSSKACWNVRQRFQSRSLRGFLMIVCNKKSPAPIGTEHSIACYQPSLWPAKRSQSEARTAVYTQIELYKTYSSCEKLPDHCCLI